MPAVKETIEDVRQLESDKYKYGFTTEIEQERAPKGLSEDTVRFISAKKGEPEWLLDWRLEAYRRWTQMQEPDWAKVGYPPIDYQGRVLLRGAERLCQIQELGRGSSGAARHLQEARHSAERGGSPARR
jgi:hypothetical protein